MLQFHLPLIIKKQNKKMINNKRIAKNTLLLYLRMLLLMAVSLYTSRVVLEVLGVTDYGIYNVVGGIVSMLGFLNSSMSNAVQRFLSYEIGKGITGKVAHVFNIAMLAHFFIAIVVFIILELAGFWYLNNHMVLPVERLVAANWVLQCTVVTTMFSIMQVPYNAIIIAKEDMGIYAYISIFEVVLRLLIVYILLIGSFDRLKLYAVLMMIATLVVLMINRIYCIRKYREAHFKFVRDKQLLKEMTSFASWNMFGEIAWVATGQGVNIILNLFYGPTINAARGLAEQINAAVMRFINNFQVALNPQITKSYSSGELEDMKRLLYMGTKISYFVLFLLALPIVIEMDFILGLWLHVVPTHTTLFCQLILICSLTACVSNLLAQVARAYGKIRKYQMIVSLFLLLNFPLSYIILKFGASAEMTVVINIFIQGLLLFVRLLLIRSMIELSIRQFVLNVIIPIIGVTGFAVVLPIFWKCYSNTSIINSLITIVLALMSSTASVFYLGMKKSERSKIKCLIVKKIKRV